jgi:hypothetical protein
MGQRLSGFEREQAAHRKRMALVGRVHASTLNPGDVVLVSDPAFSAVSGIAAAIPAAVARGVTAVEQSRAFSLRQRATDGWTRAAVVCFDQEAARAVLVEADERGLRVSEAVARVRQWREAGCTVCVRQLRFPDANLLLDATSRLLAVARTVPDWSRLVQKRRAPPQRARGKQVPAALPSLASSARPAAVAAAAFASPLPQLESPDPVSATDARDYVPLHAAASGRSLVSTAMSPSADAAALRSPLFESSEVMDGGVDRAAAEAIASEQNAQRARAFVKRMLTNVREAIAEPTEEGMVEIYRAFAHADSDGNGLCVLSPSFPSPFFVASLS